MKETVISMNVTMQDLIDQVVRDETLDPDEFTSHDFADEYKKKTGKDVCATKIKVILRGMIKDGKLTYRFVKGKAKQKAYKIKTPC
jgi:hypothetical protein